MRGPFRVRGRRLFPTNLPTTGQWSAYLSTATAACVSVVVGTVQSRAPREYLDALYSSTADRLDLYLPSGPMIASSRPRVAACLSAARLNSSSTNASSG